MRKKGETNDEEEETKKRVELKKAAAQAWLSHSQTSKHTVLEFEAQRKHAFVKGKASRFKGEVMSLATTTINHHHPSFLEWEFGQSLWDPYEIVSVSYTLERELTSEEHSFKRKRNSLRSLFKQTNS